MPTNFRGSAFPCVSVSKVPINAETIHVGTGPRLFELLGILRSHIETHGWDYISELDPSISLSGIAGFREPP